MSAKILITMEHEKQRIQVSECFERAGHKVTKMDTFNNAMDVLRNNEFDLLVSDVHLQNGGSVFDFLRWVKGDPSMRKIPFVCFSSETPECESYLGDAVRTAARALGAARYLTMEHFDGPALLQEIEWLLPQDRTGSYYGGHDGDDGHMGDGHRPKINLTS